VTNEPFDPWRAADETEDLLISFHPVARLMGGGFYARTRGLGLIVLDPDLPEAERRAVLTHELVHHERRHGLPASTSPAPDAVVRSILRWEEREADRAVAHRLVPPPLLHAFITSRSADGPGVGPAEVAEQFEVPASVAQVALDGLRQAGWPGQRRARGT
jgi:hypothetical protein